MVVRDTSSDGTCESLADGAFSIWQEVSVHLQFGAESVAQNLRDTMLILSLKLSRSALLCCISHIKIFLNSLFFCDECESLIVTKACHMLSSIS